MAIQKVDKLCIADEMLNSAIDSFFDKKYFVSINNSAVAQELYGKTVRMHGGNDQISESIKNANKIAAKIDAPSILDKEWKKIAGRVKNGIKHINSNDDLYIEIDAFDEARLWIGDAIMERDKLNREDSDQILRFYAFANDYSKNAEGML